jgi:hypothetical protein
MRNRAATGSDLQHEMGRMGHANFSIFSSVPLAMGLLRSIQGGIGALRTRAHATSIIVELRIANRHSSELNFLP